MTGEVKVLDLFSGIGGFSLGLERAGPFRTVAFCERDKFCQAVLRKHWPDVPIYDDVRTIDFEGDIDIITGGYPCQPFSVAGKQKGAADDRHLWPSMFEIIKQKRPRWVVAENVAGHITMGLDEVLFDLEGQGYTARPVVIPACAVDAPHRRDRVWIVANSQRGGRREGVLCDQGIDGQAVGERGSVISPQSNQTPPPVAHDVADTDGTSAQGGRLPSGIHAQHTDADSGSNAVGGETSFQWLPEPDVGRVANGIPRRVDRLKALGNAVVPQVVTQIGKAIIEEEQRKWKGLTHGLRNEEEANA